MDRSPIDEAILVASALQEDRASFSELLDRHRRIVLTLCERMLGDGILAEDACQEASVRAWINLSRLRKPGSFGSWFAGIALNICHEWLRRSGSHPWSREILAGGVQIEQPNLLNSDPADVIELIDLQRRVRGGLVALPTGQREAALLYYLEGLTQNEIARLLGIQPTAVKTRIHKARDKLRMILGEVEEETMTVTKWVPMQLVDVRTNVRPGQPPLYAAVLVDANQEHKLLIFMGEFEGASLAVQLEGLSTTRPMTFSFMAQLLEAGQVRLREVRLERLHEQTFYATVVTESPRGQTEVDARPSDAFNIALATGTPIVVHPDVVEAAAITKERAELWKTLSEAEERGRGSEKIVKKRGLKPEGSWE